MRTSDFDYALPSELIAQTPVEPRDSSRLMVIDRAGGGIRHRHFREIGDFLRDDDVLVFNDTRVIPARLHGLSSGAKIELLLLKRVEPCLWEAIGKPGRKLGAGRMVSLLDIKTGAESGGSAEVIDKREDGLLTVRLESEDLIERCGEVPLPPYVHEDLQDRERYQTVYSRIKGSAAAPTAGLHFTAQLLKSLQERGIETLFVTLHIGLDTFRPVRVEDPAEHRIHREYGQITAEVAGRINKAKTAGGRIVCVGTSAARLLEYGASMGGAGSAPDYVGPYAGMVDLFILPGFKFRAIDSLVTNFHLPRSTLLMLVSAFASREVILSAYAEAVKERYRFFSFGDATIIL